MGTDTVTVNLTTGLLGHLSSSRRYKEDINPMDKTSEALYMLNPVTYRFKKDIDPSRSLDYGLIAKRWPKSIRTWPSAIETGKSRVYDTAR